MGEVSKFRFRFHLIDWHCFVQEKESTRNTGHVDLTFENIAEVNRKLLLMPNYEIKITSIRGQIGI